MRRAIEAGLVAIQDRCLKIDHKAVAGGQLQQDSQPTEA
jgi:predicted CoA-binding protein